MDPRLTREQVLEVQRVCAMFGGVVKEVRDTGHRRRERRQEAGMAVKSGARILEGFPYDACDVRGMLREFRKRLEAGA